MRIVSGVSGNAIDNLEREQRMAEYLAEEREAAVSDLLHIMRTIEGRRWIDMLRRDTGVCAQSYRTDPQGCSDAGATFWADGRRSVGIDLDARLLHPEIAPYFDLMQKEHRERIRNRNAFLAGE